MVEHCSTDRMRRLEGDTWQPGEKEGRRLQLVKDWFSYWAAVCPKVSKYAAIAGRFIPIAVLNNSI
jgi:hypothetical protein